MTESSAGTSAARRKSRRRRSRVVVVAAIVAALALAGGGVALAATTGSSGDYRTATARQGDVTQVVDAVGTVAAADRYDLSFDVAGEVASVSVGVGDEVESGAVLATLDTESLQDAVDDAQSTLDDAESQLATDQEAQSSASSSSSSTTTDPTSGSATTGGTSTTPSPTPTATPTTTPTATPTTPGDDGSTDPAVEEAIAAVTTAQEALLTQYETAAAALQVSSDAVTSSGTACQPFLDAAIEESEESDDETVPEGDDTTAGESAADDGTTDETTTGSGTSTIVEALEACQAAIGTVLENQSTVDEAQSALQERATALDEAVTALRTAVAEASSASSDGSGTSGSGSTPSSSAPTESTPSTEGSPSTGSTEAAETSSSAETTTPSTTATSGGDATIGGTSTTVTAETLLADAAAITLAEQQLAIAQQQLADNTITAPASGTVAAVSLAAGDEVEAASTTAVITVLADSGYVVESTLPLSDVRAVDVGQAVAITVEGEDSDIAGTVSSIGVLNVSETSTPSFAVTVSLDDTEVEPLTGTAASLAITAAAASDVLVVPTSAVHVSGTTSTVDVLVDGTVESRQVELGAVGADYTEVADGIASGDLVVLADLDQEIASDDAETETGLTGIGGSSDSEMSGGGFPGGSLPDGFTPPEGFTPGG
ncbi:biotin/lipoyl-binding protein [Labedella gwakjiensis]|uniref:Biotin/lipoyl-binding protein n=1 Tax=Labedella gwakjiensis TaxID=390269 RepID=A0A2P8H0W6_9MICO|nr:HlyD family efflux transporter periplasmic adaptor subunit [Labedella gwakjiensis]PSL39852.1 biotin/lipoyl-binding protein [Labedella gwakjiensis]RUQ85775.1 biotin/lipoyl-binding protein [Labedella gwakjiensis]